MCKVFVTIGVNLVKNVGAFDTPFAPLRLAIGRINADYKPFASLRLWKIAYQHQAVRKVVVEEAQSRMNVLQRRRMGGRMEVGKDGRMEVGK